MDYLYDGTFGGLLTCIYHHYYTEKASGIFKWDQYQSTLLGGCMQVETDDEKAARVYEAIETKISPYDLRRIYKVYLSDDNEKEIKILRYTVYGFRIGSKISLLHGDPVVAAVQAIEKRVNTERERMLQFVRFSVVENDVLYGRIEPDNDVLELIAEHFCDRFRNDPFMIHDVKRRKALVSFGGRWYITEFDGDIKPGASPDEKYYRGLWKTYFESISIKERTNLRCQKNFMPVKYWKNITEIVMPHKDD